MLLWCAEQHGSLAPNRGDLGRRPPLGPQATLPPGALEALGDRQPLRRLFVTSLRHHRSLRSIRPKPSVIREHCAVRGITCD